MRERRQFQRWKCLISCICSGQGLFLTGQVVDLSYGGACVAKPTEIPPVGIELDVAFDGTFALKAKVVYLNLERDNPKHRDHFGLEFSGAWKEKLEKLKPLLQRYVENLD